jgi:hypothetical protein
MSWAILPVLSSVRGMGGLENSVIGLGKKNGHQEHHLELFGKSGNAARQHRFYWTK